MSPEEIAHLRILKALEQEPELSQRELARRLGISLGRTNFLLRALIEKGAIKAGSFSRNDGKLQKITYLLTPTGIGVRLCLTRAYLARKKAEYAALRDEIAALEQESLGDGRGAA